MSGYSKIEIPVLFRKDPCILASQSNAILTAIVCGMKKEEPRYVHFTCVNFALVMVFVLQPQMHC